MKQLRQSSPESRYLRCEPRLCGNEKIQEPDTGTCERWLTGIEKR